MDVVGRSNDNTNLNVFLAVLSNELVVISLADSSAETNSGRVLSQTNSRAVYKAELRKNAVALVNDHVANIYISGICITIRHTSKLNHELEVADRLLIPRYFLTCRIIKLTNQIPYTVLQYVEVIFRTFELGAGYHVCSTCKFNRVRLLSRAVAVVCCFFNVFFSISTCTRAVSERVCVVHGIYKEAVFPLEENTNRLIVGSVYGKHYGVCVSGNFVRQHLTAPNGTFNGRCYSRCKSNSPSTIRYCVCHSVILGTIKLEHIACAIEIYLIKLIAVIRLVICKSLEFNRKNSGCSHKSLINLNVFNYYCVLIGLVANEYQSENVIVGIPCAVNLIISIFRSCQQRKLFSSKLANTYPFACVGYIEIVRNNVKVLVNLPLNSKGLVPLALRYAILARCYYVLIFTLVKGGNESVFLIRGRYNESRTAIGHKCDFMGIGVNSRIKYYGIGLSCNRVAAKIASPSACLSVCIPGLQCNSSSVSINRIVKSCPHILGVYQHRVTAEVRYVDKIAILGLAVVLVNVVTGHCSLSALSGKALIYVYVTDSYSSVLVIYLGITVESNYGLIIGILRVSAPAGLSQLVCVKRV